MSSLRSPKEPAFSSISFSSGYDALWDTGATKSVITDVTALALNLTPVGSAMVGHAGGISPSNTYLVNFLLPNNVGIPGVLVTNVMIPQVTSVQSSEWILSAKETSLLPMLVVIKHACLFAFHL